MAKPEPLSLLAEVVNGVGIGENNTWKDRVNASVNLLFGLDNDGKPANDLKFRYRREARKSIAVRAPGKTADANVPYAGLIHPTNQDSGPYSGMSIAIFPVDYEALAADVRHRNKWHHAGRRDPR